MIKELDDFKMRIELEYLKKFFKFMTREFPYGYMTDHQIKDRTRDFL